jgi:hypothetical protein
MLLVYGDLAGRVAGLVRAQPTLIARLIMAPREAVHATAAYLYLASDATKSDAEVAPTISDTDPRILLNAALPGCPPTLYRALDRAGDRVQPREFYERLGHLARGPFGDVLLRGDRKLDRPRLDYYEALSMMDPALCALRAVLPESTFDAQALDALLALLRARGALREADLRLPPKAGLGAVVRRLRIALARLPAPDPGFALPAGYRLVRSTEELQVIGRAFRNCVALPQHHAGRHHLSLVAGSTVYLASDAPPLLVALHRIEGSLWVLEQMSNDIRNWTPGDTRNWTPG